MSLKEIIDKTELFIQNLKTIKSNINNVLFEKTNNYADIPEKISNMMRNYSKVSEIELNLLANDQNDPNSGDYYEFKQRIPISLNFKPQKIILFAKRVKVKDTNQVMYELISDSEIQKNGRYDIKINNFTNQYVDITYTYFDYHTGRPALSKYKFYKIIAIG